VAHKEGAGESVFKFNKISLGVLVLVYLLSVGICPLVFNHSNGHAEKDKAPDIHCGSELNGYASPEDGRCALLDLTMPWKLSPLIVEPKPPILVYSVFKIPIPA